jgi:hypothetical protein
MCSQPPLETQSESEVKIVEEQGVRARSLAHSTLGVEGRAKALGWDKEK